jgi:hypothetical protein
MPLQPVHQKKSEGNPSLFLMDFYYWFVARRRTMKPIMLKPASIIAHSLASGTGETLSVDTLWFKPML